jgi:hypothetical protein
MGEGELPEGRREEVGGLDRIGGVEGVAVDGVCGRRGGEEEKSRKGRTGRKEGIREGE